MLTYAIAVLVEFAVAMLAGLFQNMQSNDNKASNGKPLLVFVLCDCQSVSASKYSKASLWLGDLPHKFGALHVQVIS